MKYTQNDRISQLTETTLIVGVDIASQIHYARAFDFRGIEHGKVIKLGNSGGRSYCVVRIWAKPELQRG